MNNPDIVSLQPAENVLKLSWWERLVFEKVIEKFIRCPTCQAYNDSADVVCNNDSGTLAGGRLSNRAKTILINVLRVAALGVALAVGYLHWMWPTYVFASLLTVAFFSLFLRNHSIILRYFLVISIVTLIGEFAWRAAKPEGRFSSQIIWVMLLAFLLTELLFLVFYSLRTGHDAREDWLRNHQVDVGLRTLTWIAFMLTASVLAAAAFVSSLIMPEWLPMMASRILTLQLILLPFNAALVTALISSTIYSLKGTPFAVADRWKHRCILDYWRRRFLYYESRPFSSWRQRMIETTRRIAISSANRMLRGIADSCDYFIVRCVNNLALTAVKIANSLRRIAIKTALHLRRSLRRFFQISKWSAQWALHAELVYSAAFLIPPISILVGAGLLYGVSEDFFAYVHQGPALLPIYLGLKILGVAVLFTLALSLLLHNGFFAFVEKMLNALSIFGTSAFLFFLLTAWVLGIVGTVMSGPYRIGWVTILSTLLLIGAFVKTRRQAAKVDADGHNPKQPPHA